MKKVVLSAAFLAAIGADVRAQSQRLVLYEEFSGENCGPCAATNPGLWTRVSAATAKTLLIKYQVPIPSAGPIYTNNPSYADTRRAYYGVTSAPNGRADGSVKFSGMGTSSPGHPAYYLADSINAAAAVSSPFTITATHAYNATGDSVTATIVVACTQAFAPTGANMKMRVALVETLEYTTPPGSNGEKEFHNVVRRMYPDANGTSISNTWTVGQTQTYVIKGAVQNYVDKSGNTYVVAWMQNDADKSIAQTGKSVYAPLAVDARADAAATLICGTGTTNAAPQMVLKNVGTTAITSAAISYKVGSSAAQTYNWTGSLAANGSTTVTLPSSSLNLGSNVVVNSVTAVNGAADINPANNTATGAVYVHNTTANALPMSTTFENSGSLPMGWTSYDENLNGQLWAVANAGFGSSYSLKHENYNYPAGETNYAILPTATLPATAKTLSFYVAYAQYSSENDQLEVVYSSNCGQTWTSAWSKAGSTLSTSAVTTSAFTPSSASQWRYENIDISTIPVGSMIALRATSQFGNNLYVDSVQLKSGTPAGVAQTAQQLAGVQIVPNPTHGTAVLHVTMQEAATGTLTITDALGRTIYNAAQRLAAGVQQITLPTAGFAAGLYNVTLRTDNSVLTERLSVVK